MQRGLGAEIATPDPSEVKLKTKPRVVIAINLFICVTSYLMYLRSYYCKRCARSEKELKKLKVIIEKLQKNQLVKLFHHRDFCMLRNGSSLK